MAETDWIWYDFYPVCWNMYGCMFGKGGAGCRGVRVEEGFPGRTAAPSQSHTYTNKEEPEIWTLINGFSL